MTGKSNKVIAVLLVIIVVLLGTSLVMFTKYKSERGRAENLAQELGNSSKEVEESIPEVVGVITSDEDLKETVNSLENEVNVTNSVTDDTVNLESRRLSISGSRVVDSKGNTFQLRGMSSHGLLWYPEYTNVSAIETTKEWGANSFRIAMYANDEWGGYVQQKEMSRKLMYQAIENVKSLDMYAIVDWHVLNEKNPLIDVDSAKVFFSDVSSHYGNDPLIIYEICNEPNGDTTWEDICNYANQIIPVIRANAEDAIIIVGTPEYSYSVTTVFNQGLEYENVAYAFHNYAGQFGDAYINILLDCVRMEVPVIVSECGINTEYGDEALMAGDEFLSFVNDNDISWFAWSLSNKDECFSAIKADCDKYSGWTEEDLTEVGKIIINRLSGK